MANEYRAVLQTALEDLKDLLKKRDYLEGQILTKKQFIRSAIQQLPVNQQHKFEEQLEMLTRSYRSLTEAVREALRHAVATRVGRNKGFVTATQVRDLLLDSGFDFSSYKSNPLSGIHTVLTRMKQDEVETETINDVMHFRWKGEFNLKEVREAEILS